jgi:hypothetical protein
MRTEQVLRLDVTRLEQVMRDAPGRSDAPE